MAIHTASEDRGEATVSPPPPQLQFLPFHVTIDETTNSFVTTTTSSSSNNNNNTTLTIPLDIPNPDDVRGKQHSSGLKLPQTAAAAEKERPPRLARIPIRRDSLRRREELLRGNPGTRRRQRWENDRLLSNPYLTPPTPADFLPAPTHTRKIVHYDLACLWDSQYRKQQHQKLDLEAAVRAERHADEPCISRELRAGLKKARGAAGIVKMLEERVREFVEKAAAAAAAAAGAVEGSENASNCGHNKSLSSSQILSEEEGWEVVDHKHGTPSDDEHEIDEEVIVFKPKKQLQKPSPAALPSALPVYHSPTTDPSAPFIRWLVHSIAEYYGLHSWSVTEKSPPSVESVSKYGPDSASLFSRVGVAGGEVRVAYVGLHSHQQQQQKQQQQRGGKTKTKTKTKSKNKKDKRKKYEEEEKTVEEKQDGEEAYSKKSVEIGQVKLPMKMPRPLWLML